MGNYATIAELKARYPNDLAVAHMTGDAETGVPDDDVLNEIVDGAEGEMNSYIGLRHQVPVDVSTDTELAALLKSMTLDLAVVRLQTRNNKVSEVKADARVAVMEWLVNVSTGKAKLAAATPPASQTADPIARTGTAGTGSGSARTFTQATQANL